MNVSYVYFSFLMETYKILNDSASNGTKHDILAIIMNIEKKLEYGASPLLNMSRDVKYLTFFEYI